MRPLVVDVRCVYTASGESANYAHLRVYYDGRLIISDVASFPRRFFSHAKKKAPKKAGPKTKEIRSCL